MPRVAIIMGSDSDLAVMSKAADVLDEFGVDYEMRLISAHREPELFFSWAKEARDRGIKVIIAGAGMAAHLPGMCASLFPLPVIGVPMESGPLSGTDAVYSMLQMPPGIPVATVAIGGAGNAALLAVRILAVSDDTLLNLLISYTETMCAEAEKKDHHLSAVGRKKYLEEGKRIGL
ncbi:MAG: 5-(carboxyamino)imidazole ribonucleotide mutase [Lachnospiraceae bacterium]|nr:5-(carboxyamino)imidazole ribonucleotide mutase [Lachnospiraceae bacterium]